MIEQRMQVDGAFGALGPIRDFTTLYLYLYVSPQCT
jgi:hypothetical protein